MSNAARRDAPPGNYAANHADGTLGARGERAAWHRDERGARLARRDDREYRLYLREEQRRQAGRIARRMRRHFHHGLLKAVRLAVAAVVALDRRLDEALAAVAGLARQQVPPEARMDARRRHARAAGGRGGAARGATDAEVTRHRVADERPEIVLGHGTALT